MSYWIITFDEVGPPSKPPPHPFTTLDLHDWILDEHELAWRQRPERKLFSEIQLEQACDILYESAIQLLPQTAVIRVRGKISDSNAMVLMLKYRAFQGDE